LLVFISVRLWDSFLNASFLVAVSTALDAIALRSSPVYLALSQYSGEICLNLSNIEEGCRESLRFDSLPHAGLASSCRLGP